MADESRSLQRTALQVAFTLLVVSPANLRGQVFELSGGASSLFQAQGGSLSMHTDQTRASLGLGASGGHLVAGGQITHTYPQGTLSLGQQVLRLNLPTDLFDPDHLVEALGLGAQTRIAHAGLTAFAGTLSETYASPFFAGVGASRPAAALLVDQAMTHRLSLRSLLVVSDTATAIGSVGWQPSGRLAIAGSAGVGADHPYGAASLSTSQSWFDLKAAYIAAGNGFRRVSSAIPLVAEPDRGNALLTLRPTHYLTVSGGHQSFLTPQPGLSANLRSSVDDLSAGLSVLGSQISSSWFESHYADRSGFASAYSFNRDLGSRLHVQTNFLESSGSGQNQITRRSRSFFAVMTEALSPRLSVLEQLTHSQGQTNLNLGGSLLSNWASVSATYQTYYVPERPNSPFENTLLLDVQARLFSRVMVHAANLVAADGRVLYTADARAIASRTQVGETADSAARRAMGRMLVCGSVQTAAGVPVSGAAVRLGSPDGEEGPELYTDSAGRFCYRERARRTHRLTIVAGDFLDGGTYAVVAAPAAVRSRSARDAKPTDVQIIVSSGQGDQP